MKPSEMAFLSNSRWQNSIERPNLSTDNGDMVDKGKSDVMRELKICSEFTKSNFKPPNSSPFFKFKSPSGVLFLYRAQYLLGTISAGLF